MKNLTAIILTGVAVLLAAHSGHATSRTVLSERVVTLPVDISTTKMKLSVAGYAAPTVKVLVPELADVTVLNHRNEGENAPCLATFGALTPGQIIQDDPAVVEIDFTLKLTKEVFPNEKTGVCEVYLHETVVGMIRGFQFVHSEFTEVESRHLDDCR